MSEPIYSDLMEDLWSRLPAVHRDEDAKRDNVLKRWLSGMADRAGDIDVLTDQIEYTGYWEDPFPLDDSSLLADARIAPDEWLNWISMVRGIFVPAGLTQDQRRNLLYMSRYDSGTKKSIREYMGYLLTDTKFVKVYDHTNDTSGEGLGDRWDMLIVTRASETDFQVVETVVRANLKPAGVRLFHKVISAATWDSIEARYPTWTDWDAAGSWDAILTDPDEEE